MDAKQYADEIVDPAITEFEREPSSRRDENDDIDLVNDGEKDRDAAHLALDLLGDHAPGRLQLRHVGQVVPDG